MLVKNQGQRVTGSSSTTSRHFPEKVSQSSSSDVALDGRPNCRFLSPPGLEVLRKVKVQKDRR